MRDVEIRNEPIQLYKILKFEGLVSNGGEAKAAVAEGRVLVNGQVETRKRKQIVSGDIVEFAGEQMRIRLI
jgi:ribosome-associated protein